MEIKHLLKITYSIKRISRNVEHIDFIKIKSFDKQNFRGVGQ